MKSFIDRMADIKFMRFMDRSREELGLQDEVFGKDKADLAELEQRYTGADISRDARLVINDYIACMKTTGSRYADLSYIAGIKDAVAGLVRLGMVDDEEQCLNRLSCKFFDLW